MIPDYAKDRFAIADALRDCSVGQQLTNHGAEVLAGCRDIWCRDFMPIQVGPLAYVQFLYAPKYLSDDHSLWNTITPPGITYPEWLREQGQIRVVPLVLDGGAVIGNEQVALVSERMFQDNPGRTPSALADILVKELSVQHVEFVRQHPDDFTGRLDGSIRVVAADRVIIGVPPDDPNPPSGLRALYQRALGYSRLLISIARRLQFGVTELIDVSYRAPRAPRDNVQGLYTNFLQLGPKHLLVPCWGIPEDHQAEQQLQAAGFTVTPVDAHAFAEARCPQRAGGAVNCVTWNWKRG